MAHRKFLMFGIIVIMIIIQSLVTHEYYCIGSMIHVLGSCVNYC